MEGTTVERPYLTYEEAEKYTGLHRVTLWRAVRDKRLRPSGPGKAIRFHVKDLDAFMTARSED
jgi:excisionase family DNA binding protein